MFNKEVENGIVRLLSGAYYEQYFELAQRRLADPLTSPVERAVLLDPLDRRIAGDPEKEIRRVRLLLRMLDDREKYGNEDRICDKVSYLVLKWSDEHQDLLYNDEVSPQALIELARKLLLDNLKELGEE